MEDLPDINTLYEPRELAQLFVGDLSEFVESCDFMGSLHQLMDSECPLEYSVSSPTGPDVVHQVIRQLQLVRL